MTIFDILDKRESSKSLALVSRTIKTTFKILNLASSNNADKISFKTLL